jgi:hypothetical protein
MKKYGIIDTNILLPVFLCRFLPEVYSYTEEYSNFIAESNFEHWVIHRSVYYEFGNLMKSNAGADLSSHCLSFIDSSDDYTVTEFNSVENTLAKKIMVDYKYTELNSNGNYSGIGLADASLIAYLKLKTLRPSRDSYKLLTYDRDLKDATRGEGLSSSVINFIPRPY